MPLVTLRFLDAPACPSVCMGELVLATEGLYSLPGVGLGNSSLSDDGPQYKRVDSHWWTQPGSLSHCVEGALLEGLNFHQTLCEQEMNHFLY